MDAALQFTARVAFRWLRTMTRFPKFEERKLEKLIELSRGSEKPTLEDDLQELRRGNRGSLIYFILVTTIIYFFKCLLIVTRTLILFDYGDISSNFHYSWPQPSIKATPLVQFACMTTNCSRLSENNSLFQDLSRLPMFDICDPLAFLYPIPFKHLERTGLLMFLIFGFGTQVDGLVIPIIQLISPNYNECCLFVQVPHLTVALTKRRLASLAEKSTQRRFQTQDLAAKLESGSSSYHLRTNFVDDLIESHSQATFKLEQHKQGNLLVSGMGVTCLPVTRSSWFHRKLTQFAMSMLFFTVIGIVVCLCITFGWLLAGQLDRKVYLFARFNEQMMQQNCAIWRTNDKSSSPIDITGFDLSWNLIGAAECFGANFLPTCAAVMSFILFCATIIELNCSQAELQNELLFLIELKRLIVSQQLMTKPNGGSYFPRESRTSNTKSRQQTVHLLADQSMEQLQKEFKEANELSIYTMRMNCIRTNGRRLFVAISCGPSSGSRLDSALAFQDLGCRVLQMIQQSTIDDGPHQIEASEVHRLLMERVYLNFRLYLELMDHYTPSLGVIISLSYFLLYGLTIVSIWYSTKIGGSLMDGPMVMVGLVWILTNFVLLVCSAVHAKGKGLHKLIWSLIAQFEGTQDPRAAYWINLWRLQVMHLDSEKGAALRTLGFRVTYVKMVQLVIWAATMIIFVTQR